jgi:MSHA pilin protein MshC
MPADTVTTSASLLYSCRGFTLVELVTILVLVGILSVVALPRMFDAAVFRGRGFFDEVANAARYGQKLAVASGCDVRLSLSADGYALAQRTACASGAFTLAVPHPASGGSFAGSVPEGVSMSVTGAVSVVFDAQGRATPGGVTVTVNGHHFTIVGESGYVDGL